MLSLRNRRMLASVERMLINCLEGVQGRTKVAFFGSHEITSFHFGMRRHEHRPFSSQSQQLQDLQRLGLSHMASIRPSARSQHARRRRRPKPARHRPSMTAVMPVAAIHVAQSIDVFKVASTVFARNTSRKQQFSRNSIVIELKKPTSSHPESPVTSNNDPRYVAIFRYGSIVAVNVAPAQLSDLMSQIKQYSMEPVTEGFERKENFGIVVEEPDIPVLFPHTTTPYHHANHTAVTGDYCIVPELDMNGVAVIANIMAQTVALDSYNDTVDELLANFASINGNVSKTGKFTAADKSYLFRIVAQNNSIFIDMISRVRLKDRSDTAWNMIKYETIHYGMKEEFEIDDRFSHIEFKLNLIQQNSKFFLGILQHQNTNSLEWIIVALISLECVLMCVEMSGMGEPLFASIGSLLW